MNKRGNEAHGFSVPSQLLPAEFPALLSLPGTRPWGLYFAPLSSGQRELAFATLLSPLQEAQTLHFHSIQHEIVLQCAEEGAFYGNGSVSTWELLCLLPFRVISAVN